LGVGMGVAMMMQQAGVLVGAPAPAVDLSTLNGQIRKAKAEGRTVTMVNGALYFDYQLVARIPPGFDIHV
uniref:Amidohydrolase n=1 Tax=Heligmosomoides polygyrus TaxID=6339 RepID=A0A183GDC5_HELPZ